MSVEDLDQIDKDIKSCTSCKLHDFYCNKERPDPIGYGKLTALRSETNSIMIIGLNPSYNRIENTTHPFEVTNKNKKNEVFINILKKFNIFEKAYITNLVKCSTDDNTITNKNIEDCIHHIRREIHVIGPKLIIALGNQVYNALIDNNVYSKDKIVKIFHPSYQYAYKKISPSDYELHILDAIETFVKRQKNEIKQDYTQD